MQRIFKWKARKIGLLELTFYVFSRILNLQIHAHIYRSFIRHHKMLGVRIAKRKIEPQKPANPCDTRLCSCIFSVNTRQKPVKIERFSPVSSFVFTSPAPWNSPSFPPCFPASAVWRECRCRKAQFFKRQLAGFQTELKAAFVCCYPIRKNRSRAIDGCP